MNDMKPKHKFGSPEYRKEMRDKIRERYYDWPRKSRKGWREVLAGRRFDELGMEVRLR